MMLSGATRRDSKTSFTPGFSGLVTRVSTPLRWKLVNNDDLILVLEWSQVYHASFVIFSVFCEEVTIFPVRHCRSEARPGIRRSQRRFCAGRGWGGLPAGLTGAGVPDRFRYLPRLGLELPWGTPGGLCWLRVPFSGMVRLSSQNGSWEYGPLEGRRGEQVGLSLGEATGGASKPF